MKKGFLAVMAVVMTAVAVTAACLWAAAQPEAPGPDIALVTDVGAVDDESFNQACWQGVTAYAGANGLICRYYRPAADSDDERMTALDQAVRDGARVIVCSGYLFGGVIAAAQARYPEVCLIAVDVSAEEMGGAAIAENLYCATFGEEQAGFLAGYAAVREGYTRLGFLGGMAAPSVQRYGYGFVQGANTAAGELGVPVEIQFAYGGQFYGDAGMTARMDGWYAGGTQIVFACGGSIYTSVVEAALNNGGHVIGVDVNQHAVGEKFVAEYGYNPFVTSAMKGLQSATERALSCFFEGRWAEIGGREETLNLEAGDYVGLPTDEASWGFDTFDVEAYEEAVRSIRSGETAVSDALAAPPVSSLVTVRYFD